MIDSTFQQTFLAYFYILLYRIYKYEGYDELRSLFGHLERIEFMVQPTQSMMNRLGF